MYFGNAGTYLELRYYFQPHNLVEYSSIAFKRYFTCSRYEVNTHDTLGNLMAISAKTIS